jgi:ribose transport system permease protein
MGERMIASIQIPALLRRRTVVVFIALFAFVLIGGITIPRSVSASSFETILREAALLGIVALGQGIVMLSGGLDISVGNIMFLVVIYGGMMMQGDPSKILPVSAAALGAGALMGVVNGLGVSRFKVSPIIMTLGSSSILYGLIYIFGKGTMAGTAPEALQLVGKRLYWNTIPLTALIWIFLSAILIFLMHRTVFGRKVYATGNNSRTAWFSGISPVRVMVASYVLCDTLAAFAGLLLLGYLGTPTLRFTDIYTLGSIAAVAIGGIEFFAGIGSLAGTIAGALIVRYMFNFLIMINVPQAGRMIVEGAIILSIVAAYQFRQQKRSSR